MAIGPTLDQIVRLPLQQTKVHQPLHQHPNGGAMHSLGRATRNDLGDGGLLSPEHQPIERSLLRAEETVDREGAGDVAVVIVLEAATGINQQQIAVLENSRVASVMENTGIVASRHDRAVGRSPGPLLHEVLLNHRLHLPFRQTGPGHLARKFVGLRRNPARLPQERDLLRGLPQPQGMQQRTGRHQPKGGPTAARGLIELGAPGGQHQRLHGRMLTDPEGNPLGPLEVLGQQGRQVLDRVSDRGTELADSAFAAPANPFPDFSLGMLGLHEQHKRRLGAMGQEQGNGRWFVKPGQIPEIAVLTEVVVNIGVVRHQRRRWNHRGRPPELLQKPLPTLGINRRGDRHGDTDNAQREDGIATTGSMARPSTLASARASTTA